jgi:DNA-binding response OmpR family regulator
VARKDFKALAILHVEDDDNDALLLQKACERAKLPVVLYRVGDGEHAKMYLKGEGDYADRLKFPLPHVLILDLKLPCINGFEILHWLRAQAEFLRLPVLIFTSSLSQDDKVQAADAGANSYFIKPASFEALVHMVGMFQMPDLNPPS